MTQPAQGQFISLPLAKVSWSTDPVESTKFNWKHTVENLFFVIDSWNNPSGTPLRLMKVVQGTEILESVDIEEKIRDTHAIVAAAQRHNTELQSDKLPISGIYRSPVIALRYFLPDEMVRRVQVRFTTEVDFRTVYDLLERLGLKMSAYTAPSGGKVISNPTVSVPEASSNRPASSMMPPPPLPATKPPEKAYSATAMVDLRDSTRSNPLPVQSSQIPKHQIPPISTFSTTPQASVVMSDNSRPTLPLHRSFSLPTEYCQQAFLPQIIPGSSSFGSSTPSHQPTSECPVRNSPFASQVPESAETLCGPLEHESRRDVLRLPTVPPSQVDYALTSLLPPIRELPFAHGKARQHASSFEVPHSSIPPSSATLKPFSALDASPSSALQVSGPLNISSNSGRPPSPVNHAANSVLRTSSSLNLPELPKPTFIGELRNSPAGPVPETTSHGTTSNPHSTGLLRNQEWVSHDKGPRDFVPRNNSQDQSNNATTSNRRPEDPSQRPLLSGFSQNLPAGSGIVRSASLPSPAAATARDSIERITSSLFSPTAAGASESLELYSSMSADQRRAVLDDIIVGYIEDDAFLTLCEDVHNNWRRIALGL